MGKISPFSLNGEFVIFNTRRHQRAISKCFLGALRFGLDELVTSALIGHSRNHYHGDM